jgi:hypothetical protein
MIDRLFFCWVGDDDSGPEDIKDDMDLECEQPFVLKISALMA